MSEDKASDQKQFSQIPQTHLATKSTQQHLKHNVAGNLNEVEGGGSALLKVRLQSRQRSIWYPKLVIRRQFINCFEGWVSSLRQLTKT